MSRKRRRQKKHHLEPESQERWLVTYSDLITLLLVFFIVLYSMSQIQNEKFNALMDSLRTVFQGDAILSETSMTPTSQNNDLSSMPIKEDDSDHDKNKEKNEEKLDKLYLKLQDYIKENRLGNEIKLTNLQRGVQLTFRERILFDLGEARIKQQAFPILEKVGGILKTVPNEISIEGHTDNNQFRGTSKYASNWELSGTRSRTVMLFLINHDKLHPERLHFVGYGEYKPVAKNDTKAHQAMNRRVNIIVLR
ncbi:chemotaxis protein MotB [Scopulibacillus darangshiensis]|uniref:Chemotaxis protein MotB n=1 Tax=Scopulibacillus darangshiensis TaxID=442528 RepID=A0A4V2SM51_9BACL|nr:flagellar motor protein MotB [Scopulibacillus darangshiensis]TCP26006.1 chemotaxis protein MotB [Scopulibacillus darangshiensis]